MGTTSLVLEFGRFAELLQQATVWADRFTLALVAPHSEHGELPAWARLLDARSKLDRVFVSHAAETEGWLLHRLHETGSLSLVESPATCFSSNVLAFRRGGELRCFLAPTPLTRASLEVDCGVVLAFDGPPESPFGVACHELIERWRQHSSVPSGSEVDLLHAEHGRSLRVAVRPPTTDGQPSIVRERDELVRAVNSLVEILGGQRTPAEANAVANELAITENSSVFELGTNWRLHVSVLDEVVQLELDDSTAAKPILLCLALGENRAATNALLIREVDGSRLLVWRGGLLGPSRRRNAVLWSHSRLASFELRDEGHGGHQQVAAVGRFDATLTHQLVAFGCEVRRLQELFPSEPDERAGAAAPNLADLPFESQADLIWSALIGLGSLPLDAAVSTAAQSLRDEGFVQYQRLRRDGGVYRLVADVLTRATRSGEQFDRPRSGEVRAIQTEVDAYRREDWLECLVHALPSGETIDRASAMRLVFDYAREQWGLNAQRLRSGGKAENALKSTLNSAIRRGLIRRVGAAYVERVEPGNSLVPGDLPAREMTPAQSSGPSLDDEGDADRKEQVRELLAELPPTHVAASPQLLQPLSTLALPVRTINWADRQHLAVIRDLVAWHPDIFAEQNNLGRLTVAQTRAVLEAALGTEWEEAWAALDEPKTHPAAAESPLDEGALPSPEHSRWNQYLAKLTPEQRALPLSRLLLPGRMRTHCEQHILDTVGALFAIPRDELMSEPNMGRTTLVRTLEALDEALREASTPVMIDETFLAAWRRHLGRLGSLPRLVVSSRSGLHGARETLETVGEMLGVSRERIRQIEAKSLEEIQQRTGWANDLRARLERAFAGGRCIPLPLLIESDPWWRGVEAHVALLEYVLDRLLEGSVFCLELEREGNKELILARFDRQQLREVEARLLDSAAEIETPAALSDFERLVGTAAQELDPALRDYLRSLIDERLNFDEQDPERVASFGNTKNDQVIALLESQAEPIPIGAVFEALGRCRLPDQVLYFRRGVVGLERHFPDFKSWMERLVPECIECMRQLPEGRQWLVPELHQTLSEAGKLPEWLGHWHLASLLRRSGKVQYLGRLRVALRVLGSNAERIHHQDAARAVLGEAGAPQSFATIAERIRQRTDVQDATLHILLLSSPFVKLSEDSYGLVGRDVSGGPEAIAAAVEAVVQALESSERGLTNHQAFQLAVSRAGQPWTVELVTSLLRSEPQIRLARSGNVGLSAWDDVRAPNRGEFIRQQVERAGGQASIASVQDALREAYGRPLARVELTTECPRNGLRLEGELLVIDAAGSLVNAATDASDIDLTGRVGGIPAAARQHFEELLRQPLEPSAALIERARAHLVDLERAGSHNEFVEVSLARRLVELHERLLEHVAPLSPTTRRIAQAAVLYFISTDDAEDDFDLAGLDDDKAVLDAVLKHLELDWS